MNHAVSALALPPLILIVEDELPITLALSIFLSDIGYRVATTANGKEAYEYVLQHSPMLVITDYMMPVMDGIAFIAAINAHFASIQQSPPYRILMTASSAPIPVDVDGTIRKPFSLEEIEAVVQQLVPLSP